MYDHSISNPTGSADQAAQASINPFTGFQSYTPSKLDYLTEQPGGLAYGSGPTGTGSTPQFDAFYASQPSNVQDYLNSVAAADRTNPGAGTFYNTDIGSGAVVPVGQRVSGERYDKYGRVIL
jgi:hypothetical protein